MVDTKSRRVAEHCAKAAVLCLLGLAIVSAAGPTSAADDRPATDVSVGEPESVCDEPSPAALREANRIVDAKDVANLPVAEQLYESVIRDGSAAERACATRALVAVRALQKKEADRVTAERTWSERLRDSWKTWSGDNASALKGVGTTVVGIFVVLLVLGRLLTGFFTRPTTVTSTNPRRRVLWSAGLVLLGVASLSPVAASLGPVKATWCWPLGAAVMTAVVVGLIVWAAPRDRVGWLRPVVCVLVAGAVALALTLAVYDRSAIEPGPELILGAAAAVMGVALFGFARGQVLVLEVQVVGSTGDENTSAARLLVARLRALGSQNPTSVRAVEASDVTALPEDALTTVPGGGFATVLFNVLRLIRPATPWRITVSLPDDTCVVVSVTRNGSAVVDGSLIVTRADLPGLIVPRPDPAAPAGEDESDASKTRIANELLTAAAAYALGLLADRHRELQHGMCGASEWRALAFHAIALNPTVDGGRRKLLLEAAVDASPNYLLPRMALAGMPERDDAPGRLEFAMELERLWTAFEVKLSGTQERPGPAPGYEASQLRMLYNLAVAWFNVRTDRAAVKADDPSAGAAWSSSADRAIALDERLRVLGAKPVESVSQLVANLARPAAYLILDLNSRAVRRPGSGADQRITNAALRIRQGSPETLRPTTRFDYYAWACYLAAAPAVTFTSEGVTGDAALRKIGRGRALLALELATTDPRLARSAAADPSLGVFTGGDEYGEQAEPAEIGRFKRLVAPAPPVSYLELDLFAPYAEALKGYGLLRLGDLRAVSRDDLASVTKIHPSIAQRLLDAAALDAFVRGGMDEDSTSLQILQLLLTSGVGSVAVLRARLALPETLYGELVENARATRVIPTREETVARWT